MTVDVLIGAIIACCGFGLLVFRAEKQKRSEKKFKNMVGAFPRPPAYSLDENRDKHVFYLIWLIVGIFIIPIYSALMISDNSKWIAIAISLVGVTVCGFQAFRELEKLVRIRKGVQAELLVGMSLESGLDDRFTILHDFQLGDDYNHGSNIDHLVISPKAIYIVETKYKSCPSEHKPILEYDREFITDPSGYKSNDHIKQIKGIIDQFKSYCKREFDISELPVKVEGFIVYAGWGVDFSKVKSNTMDEYNIRVNAPEPMLKAMKTVARDQKFWADSRTQDELLRHLKKRNMVKVNKKN